MRRLGRAVVAAACLTSAVVGGACTSGSAPKAGSAPTVPTTTTSTTSAADTTSTEATATGSSRTVQRTIAGSPALVVLPAGAPKALVVYAHGYQIDESALLVRHHKVVTDALVAAGYAVASTRAGGDAWGDPASVDAYAALADTLRQELGTPATFVMAESMGGVPGLLLMAQHRVPDLRGFVGISPVVDLAVMDRRDEYRPSIRKAFGGSAPPATSNPATLEAGAFTGTAVRIYGSPDDTDVVTKLHAAPFVARVSGAGGRAELVACRGEHLDPSCAPADGIVAWMDQALSGG